MKSVPLTRGLFALVDDEDYDRVMQFKWFAHGVDARFYAARNIRNADGKRKTQHLHTFLVQPASGLEVLHIDGNNLNCCRRSNLKAGTRLENMQGPKHRYSNNTTGYRGVLPPRKYRPYFEAQIRARGRVVFRMPHFTTAKEAAIARDTKARELGWPEEGMNFPVKESAALCSGGDFLVQHRPPLLGRSAAYSGNACLPRSFGRPQVEA